MGKRKRGFFADTGMINMECQMSKVRCQINVRPAFGGIPKHYYNNGNRDLRRVIKIVIPLYLIFGFLFLVSLSPANAQLEEVGIEPLQLEVGSRALGMGGAFAGLADDMNAVLYNPGGMAWARGISLSVRDPENIAAIQAYPTGYGASFGLVVVNSRLSGIPYLVTSEADSSSNVVLLSFGTKLSILPGIFSKNPAFSRIGVGVNIKGLGAQTLRRTGYLDKSGSGWDMDLGLLWKGADWWSAGLSLQNLLPAKTLGGGQINWDTGGEEGFPAVAKIAGSARLIGDIGAPVFSEERELLLGGEINLSQSRPVLLRIGGEMSFAKSFYVRTGLMQQYRGQSAYSDLNFGLGYRVEDWGIDFANYREPLRNERYSYFSFLYFPEEWILVRKLDIDKPAVMIDRPIEMISLEDNLVTYDDKIEVFGKVKPGVEVYINGLRASLAPDNSFKTTVPLRMKKNLVIVEARYEGEKKIWKYKVLRKARVIIADEGKVKDLKEKKDKIESLVTMGVIEITPEEDFVMEAGVTRGELSSWLVKAAEMRLPQVTRDLFADVPRNHPLAPYIKVVTDLKLLMPFPDGTFRPGAVVSKEEGDAVFARFGVTQ
jgi:hypothetical protein